jgi:hypothetical protein
MYVFLAESSTDIIKKLIKTDRQFAKEAQDVVRDISALNKITQNLSQYRWYPAEF